MTIKGFVCQQCNQPALRTGANQKFCTKCSDLRHKSAQRRSYEKHGTSYNPERAKERRRIARDRWMERGIVASKEATNIAEVLRPVEPAWSIRVAVPFSRHGSKNAKYGSLYRSHVFTKRDHRNWQATLEGAIRDAMRNVIVKQNKVWIDIFVQKESNNSDAVNFVDAVCDAAKKAIGLDDRWFCIRRLDWEIVKHEPKVFVGICQEEVENVQACSHCGRLLPFDQFRKKANNFRGIDRACRECKRVENKRTLIMARTIEQEKAA